MLNPELTILLTTKGRDIFTLRWLWYANSILLPYHIYIADGQPNEIIVRLLSDKSVFPNISYQHELYNDTDYKAYYRKVEHALNKISTEYVMISDNDDFLLPEGINKSIQFLNVNNDFAGASGRIGFCYLFSGKTKNDDHLFGTPHFIFPQHGGYAPRSLDSVKAADRIKSATELYNVTYYSVFRTTVLRNTATESAEICFNSLYSTEFFLHLRVLCSGSIYFDSNFSSYIRQLGSSAGGGSSEDIFHEIVSGRLSEDYANLITHITQNNSIEEPEKISVGENINAYLEKYLKNRIIALLGHDKFLHNKPRILFRKFMASVYPSYKNVLWHYRRSKEVKSSARIENEKELIAVKTCLTAADLKNFLLFSGLPNE